MPGRLDGQHGIVVGASSGIGRATALVLAEAGAYVVAAARRAERLDDLQDQFDSVSGSIEAFVADVTSQDDVEQLISHTLRHAGRIDFLIYATGTNLPERALSQLTTENWQRLIETNLTGAFLCTSAVLPAMRSVKSGLIVYISSACVQMPDVSGVAYQSSKHGLVGLAHGTRIEEKSNGIRTSVIFPGLCDTEILTKRPVQTPRDVLDLSLDPRDVAEAVLFLTSLPSRAVVPELQILPAKL